MAQFHAVGQALLLGLWPLVAESSGLAVCISMGLKSRCIFAKGRNACRASVCNLYAVMSDKD